MRVIGGPFGAVMLLLMSIPYCGMSTEPLGVLGDEVTEPRIGGQVVESLPVRVVDPEGRPVVGAVVTPWALRSSQGHGWWKEHNDRSAMEPKAVTTNENGEATIAYPHFRDVQERTRTIGVSIFVDHPEYVFPDAIHIDVPREEQTPYAVKLDYGVAVELRPTISGRSVNTDDLFAFWSDGRSWRSNDSLKRTAESTLRLLPLKPAAHSVLVAELDGDRVTHMSRIVDFEVSAKENPAVVDVPLELPQRIEGVLSENVPRPITNGRIKFSTLDPSRGNNDRVTWFSWAPIRPDGTFAIEAWPAGEKIQVIALCDGFIAMSGEAPAECKNPPDPATDSFQRPQVFDPRGQQPLAVQMEPLVKCVVTAIVEGNKPVAGVTVVSWPNVGWWNSGSQIYCTPLVRCERLLRVRKYHACIDNHFPPPFRATTDNNGNATLELPEGKESLTIIQSDRYELPVFLGSRDISVALVAGQTAKVTLRLQPKGIERLGEWDKLAGVVFGCSTREGRRICASPEVRKKMDEFEKRFREAKNKRDPRLLAEAYTIVADAFADLNDSEEAAKWRKKAADEMAKAAADEQ